MQAQMLKIEKNFEREIEFLLVIQHIIIFVLMPKIFKILLQKYVIKSV